MSTRERLELQIRGEHRNVGPEKETGRRRTRTTVTESALFKSGRTREGEVYNFVSEMKRFSKTFSNPREQFPKRERPFELDKSTSNTLNITFTLDVVQTWVF